MTRLQNNKKIIVKDVLSILGIICLFIFAMDLMGESFRNLNQDTIESVIKASANPFIGLFIGLLVTALIQSSSTSTAIMITAVASGSITFHDVVPMILGANIGTTMTSTLISLGYIEKRKEFRRAFAAGVTHDFFNILVVAILFPLELKFGVLSAITEKLSWFLSIDHTAIKQAPVNYKYFDFGISKYVIDHIGNALITLLISFVGLFVAVKLISKKLYHSIIGDSQSKLRLYLFKNPFKSFGWGVLTTGIIQSSSITTSLVVPLAATGRVKIKQLAPFIYGANVGTTITAFIAAAFNSATVLNIAILHLLINVFGVLLFLPFPAIRYIPVSLAKWFAKAIAKNRIGVLLYILLVFFIIPFVLINLYQGF